MVGPGLALNTLLIQLAGGPHISDWIAQNAWAVGCIAVGLLVFHSVLGKTIPQSPEHQSKQGSNGASHPIGRYSWAWYIAATILFWVATFIIAIVHLTSSHL